MILLIAHTGIGQTGTLMTPISLQVVSTASSTRILIVLVLVGPVSGKVIGEVVPVPMVIPVPVSITL